MLDKVMIITVQLHHCFFFFFWILVIKSNKLHKIYLYEDPKFILTSALRILVKNPIKEKFYGKRKKKQLIF